MSIFPPRLTEESQSALALVRVLIELDNLVKSITERYGQNSDERKWAKAAMAVVAKEFMGVSHFRPEEIRRRLESAQSDVPLDAELATLNISVRVHNALQGGYGSTRNRTVGEVLRLNLHELMNIRNFGPVSLRQLIEALEKAGYTVPAEWRMNPPT